MKPLEPHTVTCLISRLRLTNTTTAQKPLDALHPIKSLVMPGGERMQIIMPPACEERCISFTIRKPSLKRFTLEDYVSSNRFSNVHIVNQANLSTLECFTTKTA
ncbi:P-type DNA transfer ATPase VirB11 [Escherichia coli]|uniref:P-type DNA transfer ATPase VirB11 n=1 Tax=Escherichia coli TaxID=562 RepID=A0A376YL94_ECOLX|nr:P-type DNA transfer ATPase VirB11 [Escherichia coli]